MKSIQFGSSLLCHLLMLYPNQFLDALNDYDKKYCRLSILEFQQFSNKKNEITICPKWKKKKVFSLFK